MKAPDVKGMEWLLPLFLAISPVNVGFMPGDADVKGVLWLLTLFFSHQPCKCRVRVRGCRCKRCLVVVNRFLVIGPVNVGFMSRDADVKCVEWLLSLYFSHQPCKCRVHVRGCRCKRCVVAVIPVFSHQPCKCRVHTRGCRCKMCVVAVTPVFNHQPCKCRVHVRGCRCKKVWSGCYPWF